jgi:hypothetical protein
VAAGGRYDGLPARLGGKTTKQHQDRRGGLHGAPRREPMREAGNDGPMIFAIPSKGRLEGAGRGLAGRVRLQAGDVGGARGYSAELSGLPGVSGAAAVGRRHRRGPGPAASCTWG